MEHSPEGQTWRLFSLLRDRHLEQQALDCERSSAVADDLSSLGMTGFFGAEARSSLGALDAALKRRSSTVLRGLVMSPLILIVADGWAIVAMNLDCHPRRLRDRGRAAL
ncbi:MAG: hypothetical protein WCD47_00535 [Candidatus Sulfotelmatobacter sp.]